jgi:hypothetical protein
VHVFLTVCVCSRVLTFTACGTACTQEFLMNRNLPDTFAFVNFIDKYFVKLIMHTVHIEWQYWLLVCFFVCVNWTRSYVLDKFILAPYYNSYTDGVAPYTANVPAGQTESPNQDPLDFPEWGYWYYVGLGYTLLAYSILVCYWCGPMSINSLVSEVLLLLSGEDEARDLIHECAKRGSYLGSDAGEGGSGAKAEGAKAEGSAESAESSNETAEDNPSSSSSDSADQPSNKMPLQLRGFMDFPAYNLCVKAMQRDSKMYQHLADVIQQADEDEEKAAEVTRGSRQSVSAPCHHRTTTIHQLCRQTNKTKTNSVSSHAICSRHQPVGPQLTLNITHTKSRRAPNWLSDEVAHHSNPTHLPATQRRSSGRRSSVTTTKQLGSSGWVASHNERYLEAKRVRVHIKVSTHSHTAPAYTRIHPHSLTYTHLHSLTLTYTHLHSLTLTYTHLHSLTLSCTPSTTSVARRQLLTNARSPRGQPSPTRMCGNNPVARRR